MEQLQREFKGVWIDKTIWLDSRLNALDKIILVEIDSLDNEETGCFASNQYLAEFCQCSERKITEAISKLIKLNYIYVKSFNGRTRMLGSRLAKFATLPSKICYSAQQNLPQIKNNINNKDNILNINVLDYLNKKAGTHYKPIESNLKFINARLKDYSIEDLKAVIDKQVAEWKGTPMQKYLRPETLFNATKFESYLNGLENIKEKTADFQQREYTKEDFEKLYDSIDDTEI